MRQLRQFIDRSVKPLRDRVDNMIARAIVRVVNDNTKCQSMQVTIFDEDEDVRDDVEHWQQYGISFRAPVGSEAIALAVQGFRDHVVTINAQHRGSRPTGIDEGEGGIYTSFNGWNVFCDKNGITNLGAKSGAQFVALAQKVLDDLNAIKSHFDSHTHGGVTSGGSTSGAPAAPMPSPASVAASKVKAT